MILSKFEKMMDPNQIVELNRSTLFSREIVFQFRREEYLNSFRVDLT